MVPKQLSPESIIPRYRIRGEREVANYKSSLVQGWEGKDKEVEEDYKC